MIHRSSGGTPADGKGWFAGPWNSPVPVAGATIRLRAGDMLAVEPGEAHTFIASSADYLHFVVQAPFVRGDKVDL